MIKFKEIRLYPTPFKCDVWLTNNTDKLNDLFIERYGITQIELDNEPIQPEECILYYTTKECELKGEKRYIIILKNNKDVNVIVHELTHLKWQLNSETNIEINKHSQEWEAYFMDYMIEEIMKNDYTKINA